MLLSTLGFLYGFAGSVTEWVKSRLGENEANFLLNIMANLALLGPGLIVTHRLVRNWQHKKLRVIVGEIYLYFATALRRLRMDCRNLLTDTAGIQATEALSTHERFLKLAREAESLGECLERQGPDVRRSFVVPRVAEYLTISHVVGQLRDLSQIFVTLNLANLERDLEKLYSSSLEWDSSRGKASGHKVFIAGTAIADSIEEITCTLGQSMPPSLSD